MTARKGRKIYAEVGSPENRMALTKSQLIGLAESVSNPTYSNEEISDQGSYNDRHQAEESIGHPIFMPAKLPVGSKFNSIHAVQNSTVTRFINEQFSSPSISLYQCPLDNQENSPAYR